mmetsp:Transcript_27795/g.44569  ORF Transcript_27795/g.44569 Transcript_27795/m.44569 type:complete len:276 (+) Transcript_27795:217-1044(+)
MSRTFRNLFPCAALVWIVWSLSVTSFSKPDPCVAVNTSLLHRGYPELSYPPGSRFLTLANQSLKGHDDIDGIMPLEEVMKELQQHQTVLDEAAGGRVHIIGNLGWFRHATFEWYNAVTMSNIKNVCEIGFGAGHTATITLTANSKVHLYMFDIFPEDRNEVEETVERQHIFQAAALARLQHLFEGRYEQISGLSTNTVPQFAKNNQGVKCDVILVDGSHAVGAPLEDLRNMKHLSHSKTIVYLDDMNTPLHRDLDTAVEIGLVTIEDWCAFFMKE